MRFHLQDFVIITVLLLAFAKRYRFGVKLTQKILRCLLPSFHLSQQSHRLHLRVMIPVAMMTSQLKSHKLVFTAFFIAEWLNFHLAIKLQLHTNV